MATSLVKPLDIAPSTRRRVTTLVMAALLAWTGLALVPSSAVAAPSPCGPADDFGDTTGIPELPNVITYPSSSADVPDPNHLSGWAHGFLSITSSVPVTIDGPLLLMPDPRPEGDESGGTLSIVAPAVHITSSGHVATASAGNSFKAHLESEGAPEGMVWYRITAALEQTLVSGSISIQASIITADEGSCLATGNGSAGSAVSYELQAAAGVHGAPTLEGWLEVGREGPQGNMSYACIELTFEYACWQNLTDYPTEPTGPAWGLLGPGLPVVSGNGGASGAVLLEGIDLELHGDILTGSAGVGGSLAVDFTPTGLPIPTVVVGGGAGGTAGDVVIAARNLTVGGRVATGTGGDGGSTSLAGPPSPEILRALAGGAGFAGSVRLQAIENLTVTGAIETAAGGRGGSIGSLGPVAHAITAGLGADGGSVDLSGRQVRLEADVRVGGGGDGGSAQALSPPTGGGLVSAVARAAGHGGLLAVAAQELQTEGGHVVLGNGGAGGSALNLVGGAAIAGMGGNSAFVVDAARGLRTMEIVDITVACDGGPGGSASSSHGGPAQDGVPKPPIDGRDGRDGNDGGPVGGNGEHGEPGTSGVTNGDPGLDAAASGSDGGDGYCDGGAGGSGTATGQGGGNGAVGGKGGNGGQGGSGWFSRGCNGAGGPGGKGTLGGRGGDSEATGGNGGDGLVGRGGDGGNAASQGGNGGGGGDGGDGGDGAVGGMGGTGMPQGGPGVSAFAKPGAPGTGLLGPGMPGMPSSANGQPGLPGMNGDAGENWGTGAGPLASCSS